MIAAAAAAGAWILALSPGGCRGPQDNMNSVQRAAWDRELSEARSEWQRAETELWALEERTRQLRRDGQQAQLETQRALALQRERAAELTAVLQTLEAMEQDLVAATERKGEIEVEMAAVRELEKQVADRDRRSTELEAKLLALDADLVEQHASLAAKQQTVMELLAVVAHEQAALDESAKVLRAALQQSWDAARQRAVEKSAEPAKAERAAAKDGE